VDKYVRNFILESEFLKLVNWGKIKFENYRFQVRFPYYHRGNTLAINGSRSISSKIAKLGIEKLSTKELEQLPPLYERGEDSYFKRFQQIMMGHAKEAEIENYFMAQSFWDDHMAWVLSQYNKKNPNDLIFVIVGDFHVAYQDGLIARLKKYGVENILSLSQIDTKGLSLEKKNKLINKHPEYGVRADFVIDAEASKLTETVKDIFNF
jgi:uncharacterized iron-regulated protein